MERYIAVVGGVNIDIGGRSAGKLRMADSNPGFVSSSLGGVGRNIAHNLALMGETVKLFTALGEDDGRLRVERSCEALGIDLSHALRVPGGTTGTYLYIDGDDGDMALAINDMAILEALTPAYFAAQMDALNQAALVVVDANIPAESIVYLAQHCTAPLFGDPVSAAKCTRMLPVLGRFHTLKPNRMEAEKLSGIAISGKADLAAAGDALLAKGLRRVFISLGADGVFAAERGGEKLLLPTPPLRLADATGCGDACMAALAYAAAQNLDLLHSARLGMAASAIAAASRETVSPDMSAEKLNLRLETF